MSATPVELDLGSGIVAFDGRIVEAFGFDIGDSDSRRVHIEMVEEVELAEAHPRLVEEAAELVVRGVQPAGPLGRRQGLLP